MIRKIFIPAAVFCLVFSLSAYVGASADNTKPCAAEIEKYCKDSSAVGKCLEDHLSDLSPACKEAHTKKKQEMQQMTKVKDDCLSDIQAKCQGVARGGILDCLRKNEADLQPQCRSSLSSLSTQKTQ